MQSEDDLLNLLLKSPNSGRIKTIVEQFEIDYNFPIAKIEMIHRVSGSLDEVVLIVFF